ncbi:MAG: amino acid permease [Bacteroidetes bacterium]|nr:amino acid permease [Bacteroidota bacterium]MCL6097119.1 amino acid permease [Bacteroidota bacterium]
MHKETFSTAQETSTGLKRELGLFDSTMIVVGSMIGSGIFIVSSDIARTVGSSGLLLLVWLITGVITLVGALSYGELAAMMPNAGGQYVYLREAYNPLVGFLYGWTLFLVIQTGTIAAVAVAFAKFTAVLIPWFSTANVLFNFFGLKVSSGQILAIVLILFLTYINMRGLREAKFVQNIFTIAKTLALLGLIVLGIFVGSNAHAIAANFSKVWEGQWLHMSGGKIEWIEQLSGFSVIVAIGVAMVGSLFASVAWENITFTAGEIKNPKKVIPLSLFLGTLIVTLLYVLANVAYLVVLPLAGNPQAKDVVGQGIQFAADDRVGTAAAQMFFGQPAALIMAVLIMVSTFGCNNGLILAGARVYYAMAKDNLFFKTTGELNKNSVPAKALIFQAIWASVLCLSGTYSQLLDYVIFTVLIFYSLTIIGVFILRKRKPDAERPYKAFGYPVLPILYIFLASTISIILIVEKPMYTWPGLIIVLLGIPVYFIWKASQKKNQNVTG